MHVCCKTNMFYSIINISHIRNFLFAIHRTRPGNEEHKLTHLKLPLDQRFENKIRLLR